MAMRLAMRNPRQWPHEKGEIYSMLDNKPLREILLRSLKHERGGVKVYETALSCGVCPDLKKERSEHLDQTQRRIHILEGVFAKSEISSWLRSQTRRRSRSRKRAPPEGRCVLRCS
jgi:hypothetical protein